MDIQGFYYISHIDNLKSILEHGILSHQMIQTRGIEPAKIYDEEIVSRRQHRQTPEGLSLWAYANLFFQPRNPMLYRVLREKGQKDIVVLRFRAAILDDMARYVTTGNAAHSQSEIVNITSKALKEIMPHLKMEYWNQENGTKRRIMAECLVKDEVPAQYLDAIYVADHNVQTTVENIIQSTPRRDIKVIPEPHMFFAPNWQKRISSRVFLARGDMFFSRMQTLTVSVNTVGVMGKGLASRAKYQFPRVYVEYQDLCKKKQLVVGKPRLVKQEMSLALELSDMTLPEDSSNPNWFLLFPTKQHWREDSKLSYIVDGMRWLQKQQPKWQMQSLALPALGCGLGGLDWKDAGPVMVSMADKLGIPVTIYLPTETNVPTQYLERDYLLRQDIE